MEENVKVTHAKSMNKFNFNLTLSMPIDSNSSIKKVIDINSYMFDQKVECGNGKAIVSGKIGTKILYLDTDNMTSTLTATSNFSETFLDNLITSNSYINILDYNIINNILSTDGNLKVNCDVTISPVVYMNLSIASNNQTNDLLIARKSKININSIDQFIDTKFDHTINLETRDLINKILCFNSCFVPEKVVAQDGYAVVDGKMITTLIYETSFGEDNLIKELKNSAPIKCDVEISNLNKDCYLDLSFKVDKQNEEISTDLEDDLSILTIKNVIKVCGTTTKITEIELVDDLFSTDNEVETTITKRDFTKRAETNSVSESIFNEMSLLDSEPAIDEIIANLNQNAEVTNSYVKDNLIFLEGVVVSNLIYIDENKEIKSKQLEVPFVINTKTQVENLSCLHSQVFVVDNKVKIKRGTNIETEYSLYINLFVYEKETHEIVDNFKIGKQLDYSKYDFQIFIAKPNETTWDLCKRIKIVPEELNKLNKDLPLVMQGGEKIIIKR